MTLPLEQIVAGLNEYEPDVLHAYASNAGLLADEQRAGRLRIAPRLITTGSELLTAEMARRVEDAFGIRPFDFYSTTEGLWAAQCPEHAGFHVFEEHAIVENVDADNEPVPAGHPGARVLLTNLANMVQPLIRYEIPDVITIDPDIREFQVIQRGERLTVRVVLDDRAAAPETIRRIHDQFTIRLRALGVGDPDINVEPCATIHRPANGKLRLVIADTAASALA